MRTTDADFPKWSLNILLPVGSEFEYKCVLELPVGNLCNNMSMYVILRTNGSVEWEQCEHNRKISSAEYVTNFFAATEIWSHK
jgi:hypothetical protein